MKKAKSRNGFYRKNPADTKAGDSGPGQKLRVRLSPAAVRLGERCGGRVWGGSPPVHLLLLHRSGGGQEPQKPPKLVPTDRNRPGTGTRSSCLVPQCGGVRGCRGARECPGGESCPPAPRAPTRGGTRLSLPSTSSSRRVTA